MAKQIADSSEQYLLSQSIQRGLALHLGFLSAVVVGFVCLSRASGASALVLKRGSLPAVVIWLSYFCYSF